ncbi:MAG: hypothetical protein M9908_14020 [Phyllobacteriaceae bacterium]|nr:hypothetical protein [Phyllobacteriaceae bacterium]
MRALPFVLALLAPTAAPAQTLGLSPLADRFAACAGRLAGLMEYQWLADDPASQDTEARFQSMRELVDAALAPGKEAAALARETEAKLAWERLMKRAEEDGDGCPGVRPRKSRVVHSFFAPLSPPRRCAGAPHPAS